MNISIFGSGAWGIAIAILLHGNGHSVTLRSSHENVTRMLLDTRSNPHLDDIRIPDGIRIAETLDDAAIGADMAVIATSSVELRGIAARLKPRLSDDCVIVCASKGLEQNTAKRFSEILRETFGDSRKIAVLSGPTHAEEVARGVPTACVAASDDLAVAELVQNAFMNEIFRVYTSDDTLGVELGGALKNVIALCAGICVGVGYGDNTIAALMTRGMTEIAALVSKLGGRRATIFGLGGVGDLFVTCMSRHSRNRRAGILIGQGMDAQSAMREVGSVVEGYYAAAAAKLLAERAEIEMPICAEAYNVLYEGKSPVEIMRELMTRSPKIEG
ncbi:MAG: NAD(P)-dependent glycerol-3-phosphate dehydrogenase [Oscillospiraceae bacterium]|jgi:glycerol-3-phosphate dehydrogenase (NAD(P)+)|nr:NAD(P)-dependent glycerol-3-phosphate dehydrogenase [Oscillospiraceae bacterium]